MSNFLKNWWFSYQLRNALKAGNSEQAKLILAQIEKSGVKLSWWQKLAQQQFKNEELLSFYKKNLDRVSHTLKNAKFRENNLKPDLSLIDHIWKQFKLVKCDDNLLQCTGIYQDIFTDFEQNLANFIESELQSRHISFNQLNKALEDLEKLKQGIDPQYNDQYSDYVYLLKNFAENVYCTYVAWFLIYEAGLLPEYVTILDIASGPSTTAYGLGLLLQTMQNFFNISQVHISYYSLEKVSLLQYRGLQFWRRYFESKEFGINCYFRFDTADLFDYQNYVNKLPKKFFKFIIICHCFFYESRLKSESHQIYKQFFTNNLATNGYVLLIIQSGKLFRMFDLYRDDNIEREQNIIKTFLDELDLQLEWYQYLTSTGKRSIDKSGFAKFAQENLPQQKYLSILKEQYLNQNFKSCYAIDDYIILAQKNN